MRQYLIRLDDACPTMNRTMWGRMEEILDRYEIRPLVGVIPHNEDPSQEIDPVDQNFWYIVRQWKEKGWMIALHGYNHCYMSNGGLKCLNPMWERSEFAGLPLEVQQEKIRKGYTVMKENGIDPICFFAPSHTFDANTLEALRRETNIRIISDTIGRYPYWKDDFVFIPQLTGHCVEMPLSGIYTFCFHPNTMDDKAFEKFEDFLKRYSEQFISFEKIDFSMYGNKKIIDIFISYLFFQYRYLKGLR